MTTNVSFGDASLTQSGDARVLYSYDPAAIDPNAAMFNLSVSTAAGINLPGSSDNDTVWYLGYNIKDNGDRQDPTKPALSLNWESEYWAGGAPPAAMEWHLNFVDTAGGNHRPITFFLPHNGGAGSNGAFEADVLNLNDFSGAQKLKFDWANNAISITSATPIQFPNNNYVALKQLNAAGASYIALPYINAHDQTQIGAATLITGVTKNGDFFNLNCNGASAGESIIDVSAPAITGDLYAYKHGSPATGVLRQELRNTGAGKTVIQAIANGASGDAMFATEAGQDWSFGTRKSDGAWVLSNADSSLGTAALTVANSTRWAKFQANLSAFPAASVTPTTNGEMTFQLTNDTTLLIKVKGSDGVVRSATLTLS